MFILGLTGSIGMGKSTVAEMFAFYNAGVCNADELVHQLLGRDGVVKSVISTQFPASIDEDGTISRKKLGALVFGNDIAMKRLENIIHPKVQQMENEFITLSDRKGKKLVVLDIPLLYETGAEKRCDKVAVVSAPYEVQKVRVMKREGMTEEKFQYILSRQMADEEKRQRADFVINTGITMDETLRQVREIIEKVTHA